MFLRVPYTKTSLIFSTAIKVWNIQCNICSLLFRDFKYLIFSCFSVHFTGQILIDWRWIFKKKERFLLITDPFTKTSLSFYTGVKVWKIQFNICSLFFRICKYLIFSCFSVHLAGKILIDWRWIFKNQERFLSITKQFTKNSLSFYTGVTNWEIWKLLWNLFSRNSPYLPGIRFAIFSQLVELVS